MSNEEYHRLLDSLVRFYNSQVTVHVGYLLTLVGVFFAVVAIVNQKLDGQSMFPQYIASLSATIAVTGVFLYYPVKYVIARIQYHETWSSIVWEHMGLEGYSDKWLTELRTRALRTRSHRGGIQPSIASMFEARLYISQCFRRGELTITEKGSITSDDMSSILVRLQKSFGFDGFNDRLLLRMMIRWHFGGKVLIWDKTSLLEFAYWWKIRQYSKTPHSCQKKPEEGVVCLPCVATLLTL